MVLQFSLSFVPFSAYRKDLVCQENKFTTRLEEAEKEVLKSQSKANDLACQVDELERNLTIKSWNVEREPI